MELDLGALTRRRGDGGAAADSLQPGDDRVAQAAPVVGHVHRVEAAPRIPHEDRKGTFRHLREDVEARSAGVLRCVDESLSRSREHLTHPLVGRRVARHDELHWHSVQRLDLGAEALEVATHRRRRSGRRAVQPRSQLALLPPRQGPCGGGIVCALLDQCQRLQDRVVEVGRHPVTLLGADPLTPLLREVVRQSCDRRRRDESQPGDDGHREEDRVACVREIEVQREQAEETCPGQRHAGGDPNEGATTLDESTPATTVPRDQQTKPDECHRPRHGRTEPEAERVHEKDRADDDEPDPEHAIRRPKPVDRYSGDRPVSAKRAHRDPGDRVEEHADTTGDGQGDERDPDDEGIDAQRVGDARRDARDEAALAPERRDRPAVGRRCGRVHILMIPVTRCELSRDFPRPHPQPLGVGPGKPPIAARCQASDDRGVNDMTAPTQGTQGGQAGPRRLVRTSDGKIGGVAAGIGHYLDIDPTIVRLAFVALTFAGGLGLLLYVIGWVVIPKGEIDQPGREQPLDGWLVVGLVGIVAGVGLLFGWHGVGDAGRATIAVALIVGGVVLLGRSREQGGGTSGQAVAPPPPSPSPSPGGTAGEPAAPTGEATTMVEASDGLELEAPGRRRPVTAGVLSLLAIGVAALLAGMLSGWLDLAASTVLAAALLVVAAGLIVASVVGPAPWLFVVASLLTGALLVAAVIEPWVDDGVGERTYAPVLRRDLPQEYRLGAGDLTVDLTETALSGVTPVVVRLGVGEATIRVPADVDVELRSHVGAGRLEGPSGASADGVDERLDLIDDVPGERGRVVVDLRVGIGRGVVVRG